MLEERVFDAAKSANIPAASIEGYQSRGWQANPADDQRGGRDAHLETPLRTDSSEEIPPSPPPTEKMMEERALDAAKHADLAMVNPASIEEQKVEDAPFQVRVGEPPASALLKRRSKARGERAAVVAPPAPAFLSYRTQRVRPDPELHDDRNLSGVQTVWQIHPRIGEEARPPHRWYYQPKPR